MKKILLILFAIQFSVLAFSQQQDTTHVTITLAAKYHAYIIGMMVDKSTIAKFKYLNQLAEQITDTANKEKAVTVIVPESLIVNLYYSLSIQPERLTSQYNNEIKDLLIPQIMSRPLLLGALQNLNTQSDADRNRLINNGFSFIQSIRQ